MEVTPLEMVTLARRLHLEKALPPMEVTPLGIVTLARLLHPEKTYSPMEVTPSGMVTLARLVHPEKAKVPMEVTLPGMVTLARLLHPEKTYSPMEVTLLGRMTPTIYWLSLITFMWLEPGEEPEPLIVLFVAEHQDRSNMMYLPVTNELMLRMTSFVLMLTAASVTVYGLAALLA